MSMFEQSFDEVAKEIKNKDDVIMTYNGRAISQTLANQITKSTGLSITQIKALINTSQAIKSK